MADKTQEDFLWGVCKTATFENLKLAFWGAEIRTSRGAFLTVAGGNGPD